MSDPQTPWYDRPLTSNVLAGLIVAAILAIFGLVVAVATAAGVPVWAWIVVLVVALAAASVIVPRYRRRIWAWVPSLARWIRELQLLTLNQREALELVGYVRRNAEVEDQRASVAQPIWRFEAKDALGEHNLYWLNNHGAPAKNVLVTTDSDFFVTDGQVGWASFGAGGGGGSIGSFFKGIITEKGRAAGVTFHVTWDDLNSAPQQQDVFMPSEDFRAGRDEGLRVEHAKGVTEGRAAVLQEQAAARASFINVPRWSLSGSEPDFTLWNHNRRSIALAVRIDPVDPLMFSFESSAQWENLSPDPGSPATGHFGGHANWGGASSGITFEVSWTDEANDRQSTKVFLEGWDLGVY